jgi:putative two-component system response regulator
MEKQLILAVDDEAGNLQLLVHILGDDYRLLCAKEGERALALARDKQPLLILLDIVMPGIDGYTVCRRLKADPATAAIPVLFVTSRSAQSDESQGLACGAAGYIDKPVNPELLRAAIREQLDKCVPD